MNITKKYKISTETPQFELYDLGRVLTKMTDQAISEELLPLYRYWFINLAIAFYKLPIKLVFQAMMEEWTPEQVAVVCGIDPDEIPEEHVYGRNEE